MNRDRQTIQCPNLRILRRKRQDDSAIILVTVLFVLVILTILAISLGRGAQIELSLTKQFMNKMKARHLVWAGLNYSIDQLRRDTDQVDTFYYCGISSSNTPSPEELFREKKLTEGSFSVRFECGGDSGGEPTLCYGFQDEDRKFNLNALTLDNVGAFTQLLILLSVDGDTAQTIAYSVLDWIDADNFVAQSPFGAEDEYYQKLAKLYHCKNRTLDSKEELLFVRGVTQEIYWKMSPFITIYPKQGPFKVNFDTASPTVLKAISRAKSGAITNTSTADADSLAEKMLEYRKGSDGQLMTPDDQKIDQEQMGLNSQEKVIFLSIFPWRTQQSQFFRVHIEGLVNNQTQSLAEAVVQRSDLSIVDWHRE